MGFTAHVGEIWVHCGRSIQTRPYGTHVGQIWAEILGILVNWSHMVLMWAFYGFNSPHGANTRPKWAESR